MTRQRAATRRVSAGGLRSSATLAWVFIAVISAVLAAVLVGADVRRGWLLLVALSAAFVLSRLSRRLRLWVLFAAVFSSVLLMSSGGPVPFQLTLSQALLLFVTGAEVLARIGEERGLLADSAVGARFYIAFVAFAALGLVSTYANGEVQDYWSTVCLAPLLLLYVADRLVEDGDTAFELLKAAVVAAFAFIIIIWVAQMTGHSYSMSEYGSGFAGRFADALQVDLGPLTFQVWSIRVGSLAALGIPAVLVLALGGRRRLDRWAALAAVVAFVLALGFTAARGAIIGAAVGGIVAVVVSRRLSATRALVFVLVAVVAVAAAWPVIVGFFPEGGIQRILALGGGLSSIRNFVYRVNVWDVTLRGIADHPLGPGFNYLWLKYGLDEAIAYTAILNGTGILGFLSFVIILVQMARRHVHALWARVPDERRDLAAIGLGTLVAALLAAVSSQSVFVEPVQTVVFWTVEIAAVLGIALYGAEYRESAATVGSDATGALGDAAAGEARAHA